MTKYCYSRIKNLGIWNVRAYCAIVDVAIKNANTENPSFETLAQRACHIKNSPWRWEPQKSSDQILTEFGTSKSARFRFKLHTSRSRAFLPFANGSYFQNLRLLYFWPLKTLRYIFSEPSTPPKIPSFARKNPTIYFSWSGLHVSYKRQRSKYSMSAHCNPRFGGRGFSY